MSLLTMMIRRSFKKNDDKRDAGLKTPADVRRYDGICYDEDRKWNVLDVYRPKDSNEILPVIVSVHGGGWVYGDKERYQYYCMSLVKHGFAVVNFTYRLAPEHKYPASLEDTSKVFSWVLEHSEEYGFDRNNVFAVGDSAGAQLLGQFCNLCTNEEFRKQMGIEVPEGFVPKAVALNCGAYDSQSRKKNDLGSKLMKDVLPKGGTPEELQSMNVFEHLTSSFPPAFVMTAEGDFLVTQAMPLVERLQAKGVKAEYHYYGDPEHVLGHVFHCNMNLPEAHQCNADECDFFRRMM